jgi:hypothetical protein
VTDCFFGLLFSFAAVFSSSLSSHLLLLRIGYAEAKGGDAQVGALASPPFASA